MTLFEMLLVSHLIGDFLLQTGYEATNKARGGVNRALLQHCLKYTLAFVPALFFCGLSWWWLVWVFGTHAFLDQRFPVIWWRRHVCRDSIAAIMKTEWVTILHDQVFHVLVLAVMALLV